MKKVHPNRTLLQELGMTTDSMFDHIGKELLRAVAVAECVAVLDPRQLVENRGALIFILKTKLRPCGL